MCFADFSFYIFIYLRFRAKQSLSDFKNYCVTESNRVFSMTA